MGSRMKIKSILIILSFMVSNIIIAQEIETISLGNEVATNIDQDKLYSELNKLFDEFNDDCHSRRINSRSPFINLLDSALENSGASFAQNSQKQTRSSKNCKSYVINNISYTFDYYYNHYCNLSHLSETNEVLSFSRRGLSVAEEYYSDMINECSSWSSKNSTAYLNEWNTAINIWSRLLADKTHDIFTQRKVAEENKLKRLDAEKQAKEEARIAEIERQKTQELKTIADAKKAAEGAGNSEVTNKQVSVNSVINEKASSENQIFVEDARVVEVEKQRKNEPQNLKNIEDAIKPVKEAPRSEETIKQPPSIGDDLIEVSTSTEDLQTTIFIMVLIALIVMLIAGSTNKIVIYYDFNDFLISFMSWASLLIGLLLVINYQQGDQSVDFKNLSVLQTRIWFISLGVSGLFLVWSIKLSILHNRNTILGIFVGFFKVLAALLGVLMLIGSVGKIFNKESSTKHVIIGVLVFGFFMWLGKKLINGDQVYLAKGWEFPRA